MSKQALSILIPVYNTVCVKLVNYLSDLAWHSGIDYEIIVSDDASPARDTVTANEPINQLPHCRFIARTTNVGSAANRNFLASQSQYPWLLFIDADIDILNMQFLVNYLPHLSGTAQVINGGVDVLCQPLNNSNLRYRYELAARCEHTADKRQRNRYQAFRSTNFIISREAFERCRFDERFTMSGYEDVLFGKQLKQQDIEVLHIDNPVTISDFESNADYVAKTERNLRTLYRFRNDLRGYSSLLKLVQGIHIPAILWLIRLEHRLFGEIIKRNLCGSRPHLSLFKIYRLGYFVSLFGNHREG